jgi:E3 ubiquitin-protein ligase TRIP12
LECADERHLSDDNDEDEEDEDALDAIVDDLEDDLSDDGVPDPSAVNMEVGSGGTVTARNEDGTRVATPQQSTPTGRPSSSMPDSTSRALGHALALAGRSLSYATMLASNPPDWHIEFEIDGKPIPNDTTIYRAIHHNRDTNVESPTRNVWSAIHTVKFKRVQGPPPPELSTIVPSTSNPAGRKDADQMPESLRKHTITSSILQLLRVLHRLNSQLDDILDADKGALRIVTEPLSQFINTKLTAKLNRQLEEPLIVASNCLPSWSEDLARHFPFLFPFETRHLFLQSTSFGYARSMMRWQGSQATDDNRRDQRRDDRPFTGRLQRQKVRISRNRILDSAMKVLELYGASPSVLEVEYFEEVGTGLGPTLEFYSTVSKEFAKKKLKLWRDHDSTAGGEYVVSKLGLFPAPMTEQQALQESGKKQLQYFKSLGKFVARSMLDSRIIDLPFNPAFFRVGNDSSDITPSIGTVSLVDPDLASSLTTLKHFVNGKGALETENSLTPADKEKTLKQRRQEVEDLALDFTLPGYPDIQLIPDGANHHLTLDNVDFYIQRVIDMTLVSGVKWQLDAFREGFSQVFPYSSLLSFTPDELVMLFGQVDEDWSIESTFNLFPVLLLPFNANSSAP